MGLRQVDCNYLWNYKCATRQSIGCPRPIAREYLIASLAAARSPKRSVMATDAGATCNGTRLIDRIEIVPYVERFWQARRCIVQCFNWWRIRADSRRNRRVMILAAVQIAAKHTVPCLRTPLEATRQAIHRQQMSYPPLGSSMSAEGERMKYIDCFDWPDDYQG